MGKPKLKLGQPVAVIWEDASGSAEWAPIDAERPVTLVCQIGFFVRYDNGGLVLAGGLMRGRLNMLSPAYIPRGCIRRVVKLRGITWT